MKAHEIELTPYSEFRPTGFDSKGLGLDDRQTWLVAPCGTNRDADALTRSNWRVQAKEFVELDPNGEDHEVHRFGHWGPGWYKIVVCRPGSPAELAARVIQLKYDNYPSLDDDRNSDAEQEEANEVWKGCYSDSERIDYIRRYRSQFEFQSFADMLGCVRGKYFVGYASELIYR